MGGTVTVGESSVSLARSVGRFFGHVVRGIRDDGRGERIETRREVEEREASTRFGEATVRRTVIEEIELRRADER